MKHKLFFRKTFLDVSLILVGVFLGALISEIVVRLLDMSPKPIPSVPVEIYKLSENPQIAYEYLPNIEYRKGYKFNEEGLRDRTYPLEKTPKTIRIIVLGDSTTAGNGVDNIDDVYVKQLERLLNLRYENVTFQVLNFGVSGYHTLQEVELLRTKGLKYKPDYVLLGFCVNDFDLNVDGNIYERLLTSNKMSALSVTGLLFFDSLMKKSRLAFVLYHRLSQFIPSSKSKKNPYVEYESNFLKGKSTVEVGLNMLSDLQKMNGFESLIFILPALDSNFDNYKYQEIHDKVKEITQKIPNMSAIDLREDFQRINNDPEIFAIDNVHFNPYGNRIIAEILKNKLSKRWFDHRIMTL